MTWRRTPLGSAVLIGCLVVLALGPLVLTLLRADDYNGSVTVSFAPGVRDGVPLVRNSDVLSQLQGPLRSRRVQRQVASEAPSLPSAKQLPDYVTIAPAREDGAPAFVFRARGPTPEEARQLAQATAAAVTPIVGPAVRLVEFAAFGRLKTRLQDGAYTPAERQRVRTYQRGLQRQGDAIFASQTTLGPLADKKVGDRVLSALPGSTPARPSPVWAGLAGLGLALAFGVWVIVLSDRATVPPGGFRSSGLS
jgi:hypothetical protein